jgi:hypothetical protein
MSIRTSRGAEYLRRYFRSGWAFLIPYLAGYLLYWWLKWPVNPGSVGASGGSPGPSLVQSFAPPLLYVYWVLHAINAILAVIALVSWWRGRAAGIACKQAPTQNNSQEAAKGDGSPENGGRSPSPSLSLSLKITPWLLLALLFYIPGVYLEFPADPWEHYARINGWSYLQTVGEHSYWAKSSYFLAYSLLGRIAPPTRQLFWLDFYYTGVCLLLCWQYFRLARAVGLGERASMMFVILQTVLFGNNIFGFYRYYGISSSIFAQLGAIALIRMAIDFAKGNHEAPDDLATKDTESTEIGTGVLGHEKTQEGSRKIAQFFARLCALLRRKKSAQPSAHEVIACKQAPIAPLSPLPPAKWLGLLAVRFPGFPLSRFSVSGFPLSRFACLPLSAFQVALCAACLLALIAFNHVQGLGIAGLGLLAVIIWRLIEWKRSMVFWLAVAAIALSVAAVLWWPRNPALDAAYRPAGWLTAWYGFNVFAFALPVGDRTLQIVGLLGLFNLAAGLLLLRRNDLVGWLTITPLIALSLPFIAIPFAGALAQHGGAGNIITFQRMLFAIPAGLALVALGDQFLQRITNQKPGVRSFAGFSVSRFPAFPLSLLSLATLLVVPANGPYYNRSWQALMIPPDDLMMKPIILTGESAAIRMDSAKHLRLVATAAVANVFNTIYPCRFPYSERLIGHPASESSNNAVAIVLSSRPTLALQRLTMTHDPLAKDPLAWITLAGSPPEFVTGIENLRASTTALQNPPGQPCETLTSDLIPINLSQNYQIEFSARQCFSSNATAYLAVAWYEERGRLLESYIPAPTGAGSPVGWTNGTYSYFGLVGTLAPATWTTYRKSFGLGEVAAIPPHAKFVRVGALLNYNATPVATIQVTNVRLWRKQETRMLADGAFSCDERIFIAAPLGGIVWTYASQAGQASHHWSANEVATDLAGGVELTIAARAAGGTPIEQESSVFEFEKKASAPNHQSGSD